MITFTEAEDEVFGRFYSVLSAQATGVIGYVPEVRWHNVEVADKPDSDKFYIVAEFISSSSYQAAFADCVLGPGQRLYATEGLARFLINAPKSVGGSGRLAVRLAEIIQNGFRGHSTPGGVWFRNERIHTSFPENQFYIVPVVVEFYFQEVR